MNAVWGFVAVSIVIGIPVALILGLFLKMHEGTEKPAGIEEEKCTQ